jgi:carboxypeptidase Taq
MNKGYSELVKLLQEVNNMQRAAAVLRWDQSTYMPPGGAPARSRQLATLQQLAQEKFTDKRIGRLLDALEPYTESLDHESVEASLIRHTRRNYDRALKVPPEFTGKFTAHASNTYQKWTVARPANEFKAVQPDLEKMLDYCRQLADFFPGYDHIADPLIAYNDYGMTVSTIRSLFAELREQLVPLVNQITSQPALDDSILKRHYPEQDQLSFSDMLVKDLGYDFRRGRSDLTHHPFETTFSIGDVRITTRVNENYLGDCLFSMMHEAGHAMYEQGISMELEGIPLARGTSSGVHESQSRLWENLVGRSLGFWRHYFPELQDAFPDQLADTDLEAFYRAINKVERSLIRTEADEVTYNLHVMIRFDLELALLEGELAVNDLPAAWNQRYEQDLGISPPDDRDGVLQDIHWYGMRIGGLFQGYTLGNILGAQFYQRALLDVPQIPEEIQNGQFNSLREWLIENIYQHGSKFTTNELVERVTGGPISIDPYIHYLKRKYGALYTL